MIWLDGHLVDAEHAKVSVFDRGFLYGDGLFETLPVYDGMPFLLDEHLRRLQDGARSLRYVDPPPEQHWRAAAAAVIGACKEPSSTLRLWMSRGRSAGLSCSGAHRPTWVAACLPARYYEPHIHEQGTTLFASERIHLLPDQAPTACKHANYLGSILAFDEAQTHAADEALLCNARGQVCEGAYSNLFFVLDGELITPPLSEGPLAGIARACVLSLAAALGLRHAERPLAYARLGEAEEAFMTNSLIGLAPIRRVVEARGTVAEWAPGPITRRLGAAYADLVRKRTGAAWPPVHRPSHTTQRS